MIILGYLYSSAYGACLLAILALSFFVISRNSPKMHCSRLWFLSFISFSIAMALMFLRGLGNENPWLVAAINLLMYTALITDYFAISLWVKKRINFPFMYTLTASVFLIHMFYLFVEDNIQVRVFLIRVFLCWCHTPAFIKLSLATSNAISAIN